jgi:hypothetical protein
MDAETYTYWIFVCSSKMENTDIVEPLTVDIVANTYEEAIAKLKRIIPHANQLEIKLSYVKDYLLETIRRN